MNINCVSLNIGKDLACKNGKPIQSVFTESEFTPFIKNIYYTLMTRGIDGIRVYIEDSNLKQYFLDTINA
ncbi:DNA/RNA helicase domain-containing protein [Bacillus weihaiensis]|uniref:DNA/RNA helicase domain-containing protein n=1 Tax=Bacillus weihaiensis TaxID=1547283 RepID=UPI0034E05545